MAPSKRSGKQKVSIAQKNDGSPPAPFKIPAPVFEPFIELLSKKHIYITHIDNKPAELKRKIFIVPILMNIGVVVLFALRMYYVLPWYWKILMAGFGHPNETTFNHAEATWGELGWEIWRRGLTMFIDFMLFVFLWPWPVEFAIGKGHGSPVSWRLNVGFQEMEIYVRRSRGWDTMVKDIFKDGDSMKIFTTLVQRATSPLLQEQKSGYLLMDGKWNLDWEAMVLAHSLVDKKDIALQAFKNVILIHHEDYGWLSYDLRVSEGADEDEKRRNVFAFRDALTAMGKEDLFYRWVEIVQFESTQPGGFSPEKQEAAAKKIRDMFETENISFDELWKESTGTKS